VAEPPAVSRNHLPTYALVVVIGLWAMIQMVSNRSPEAIRCGQHLTPDADTVVMLSATWCGYCRQARRYLVGERIKYCEYDIETDAEGKRRFAAQAVKVIPILTLRDQTFVGFEREEIEQALVAKGLRKL
jgi:glutaredoxin